MPERVVIIVEGMEVDSELVDGCVSLIVDVGMEI